MSKKDYIEVARILRDARTTPDYDHHVVVEANVTRIARDFADTFAAGNPRFDRARFLDACGVVS